MNKIICYIIKHKLRALTVRLDGYILFFSKVIFLYLFKSIYLKNTYKWLYFLILIVNKYNQTVVFRSEKYNQNKKSS